jgi:O-antigen ligase
MTRIWVNLALIFGTLGFVGVLLVILAGFLGCCAGITTLAFQKILLVILGAAVVAFAWCMYHNCRKSPEA